MLSSEKDIAGMETRCDMDVLLPIMLWSAFMYTVLVLMVTRSQPLHTFNYRFHRTSYTRWISREKQKRHQVMSNRKLKRRFVAFQNIVHRGGSPTSLPLQSLVPQQRRKQKCPLHLASKKKQVDFEQLLFKKVRTRIPCVAVNV